MPGSIVKTHNNPNDPLLIQVTQINFLSLLDYLNIVGGQRFFSVRTRKYAGNKTQFCVKHAKLGKKLYVLTLKTHFISFFFVWFLLITLPPSGKRIE